MTTHINALDAIVAFTRSRLGLAIISLTTLFLIVLVLMPHAISYSIKDWMNNNGADETQVEDINFNPFTGKLELINLRVTVANDYTLQINNAWLVTDWIPLFKKSLYIKEVLIQDTKVAIEKKPDGNLNVGGIKLGHNSENTPANKKPSSTAWGIGLEKINVRNANFTYYQPDLKLDLVIDSANIYDLHTQRQTPTTLKLAGKLNSAPLSIDAKLVPFAQQPSGEASINLKALPLSIFQELVKQQANINSGKIGLDVKVKARYDSDKGLQLDESGLINITELAITREQTDIKSESLKWQGTLTTQLDNTQQLQDLSLTGGINAGGISMRNIANDSEVIKIKALSIDQLNANPQQLQINEVTIATLLANLLRDKKGHIVLPKVQPAVATTTPAASTSDNEKPFSFRISRINIAENSQLNFKDVSTTPDFKSNLVLNNVDITDIDSSKPEQAAKITLDGKIDKFSSIKANGNAHPFKSKLSLDLTVDIKAMEMPPLSSYTSSILGHNLLKGQLNSTINVKIKENLIDGRSKLLISQLEVQELTPEEKKKINTTASSPLSLGLTMLRDRDNNIKLEFPVTGDINDPKLDISDAINQAMSKAIATASLAYLKFSLQPFGTLLAIADAASGIGSGVQLQPMIFDSSLSQLNPAAIEYKNKIVTILNERPQLRIKVCGIATTRDRNTLIAKQQAEQTNKNQVLPQIPDSVLLNLAQQRADNLKDALINQHQISADRLFSCLPKIDSEAGTEPRVEMGI